MFKSNKKRLGPDEIEQAKSKILEEYDHLIVRFMKPTSLKEAFLDRYFDALRAKLDMAYFLHAEMTAVKEIFKRETDKAEAHQKAKAERENRRHKKSSVGFADRIIEEHKKKIEKYPELNFHPDASPEIKKMAGILKRFEEDYWPAIDDLLRRTSTTLYSNSRLALEKSVYELATSSVGSPSNRLSVYQMVLGRFPRDYRAVEREGQLYLLTSAHFLHNLLTEVNKMKTNGNLEGDEMIFIENASKFVHTVIEDFRLMDLKPNT